MQAFLTKCPKCLTAFKVDNQQLEAAAGSVRCGACLSVFNAKEHLIKENGDESGTQNNESTTLSDDDDVHWTQALGNDVDKIFEYLASELELNSDPDLAQQLQHDQWGRDLLAELDEQSSAEHIPLPVQAVDFLEANPDEIPIEESSNQDIKESAFDESLKSHATKKDKKLSVPTFEDPLNEQLLELPNTYEPLLEVRAETQETETEVESDFFNEDSPTEDSEKNSDIVPSFIDPVGLEREHEQEHDHSVWHPDILEELENQSRNIAASIQTALNSAQTQENTPKRQEPEYSLKDLADLPLSAQKHTQASHTPETQGMQTPKDDFESTTADSNAALGLDRLGSSLQAELSQEAMLAEHQGSGTRALKYLFLSLLAVFALVLQFAFFRADILSVDIRFRPYYQTACSWLNCQLKPMEDMNALDITSMKVRNHPDANTALIVDINMINQAQFEQAFPDIELIFSDQNGNAVAQRRFTPDEYRGEMLKQFDYIPAQQQIHIVLEIVDPNPQGALSYDHNLYRSRSS